MVLPGRRRAARATGAGRDSNPAVAVGLSAWLVCDMESCKIAVRLTPRARADEIVGERNGALRSCICPGRSTSRSNGSMQTLPSDSIRAVT